MSFLLDTCTVSYFLKENANVLENMSHIKPQELCISVITVFEINYGFKLNKTKNLNELIERWNVFSGLVNVINFDSQIALTAADIRSSLRQKGLMIGAYDILIGATALSHNLTCITNNTSEFQRIENLKLLDWSI